MRRRCPHGRWGHCADCERDEERAERERPRLFDERAPSPDAYPFYDGTPPHEAADTSKHAAESIERAAVSLQHQALVAIKAAPAGLTDEEGIAATGMAANTWRPRRRELELAGLIHHEGTRLTKSKRRAKVWVVTASSFWLGFLFGSWVGAFIGLLVAGMLAAAKHGDDQPRKP